MGDYHVTKVIGTPPYAVTVEYTYGSRGTLPNGEYYYTDLKRACYNTPAVPEIVAVPPKTIVDNNVGWNASAYSYESHAGDCYTQFQLPDCLGAVVGFAPLRKSNDPRDIPHGFYIREQSGRKLWSVSEGGVEKTTPVARDAATDTFRIERRRSQVSYFHNGKRIYVSAAAAVGNLVVVACLYSAGDGVN